MALVEKAIYQLLSTNATISQRVGEHIYPLVAPQGLKTFPRITYQRVSTIDPARTLSGKSGLAQTVIQVSIWDVTYQDAKEISEAVDAALVDYVGSVAGITIEEVARHNSVDYYEPPQSKQEVGVWHVAQDYAVIHKE